MDGGCGARAGRPCGNACADASVTLPQGQVPLRRAPTHPPTHTQPCPPLDILNNYDQPRDCIHKTGQLRASEKVANRTTQQRRYKKKENKYWEVKRHSMMPHSARCTGCCSGYSQHKIKKKPEDTHDGQGRCSKGALGRVDKHVPTTPTPCRPRVKPGLHIAHSALPTERPGWVVPQGPGQA